MARHFAPRTFIAAPLHQHCAESRAEEERCGEASNPSFVAWEPRAHIPPSTITQPTTSRIEDIEQSIQYCHNSLCKFSTWLHRVRICTSHTRTLCNPAIYDVPRHNPGDQRCGSWAYPLIVSRAGGVGWESSSYCIGIGTPSALTQHHRRKGENSLGQGCHRGHRASGVIDVWGRACQGEPRCSVGAPSQVYYTVLYCESVLR
ncbi:hypothetical protein MRB53_036989 [Persea americana]|nr:hypothetical protein MRB53_036989 [Persea americana]